MRTFQRVLSVDRVTLRALDTMHGYGGKEVTV